VADGKFSKPQFQITARGAVIGYREKRLRHRYYLADKPPPEVQHRGTRNGAMGFLKHTVGIGRADLTRDCLQQLRLWPGCETVAGLGVLGDLNGGFTVHVIEYGAANKKVADRALRCIQREKLRRFHLRAD
jgi:hypothetical protein